MVLLFTAECLWTKLQSTQPNAEDGLVASGPLKTQLESVILLFH